MPADVARRVHARGKRNPIWSVRPARYRDLDGVPAGHRDGSEEDKHLRKPGLAPPAWREAAQFGVDLVEGATGQRITGNLATLPFRGGAELVAFLGRKTGISPWVIGGIVAAGAALARTSPQRRQAIGKYVLPVAEALVTFPTV
jgi:hypothetical protein